tara:strand:- start:2364 stop:3491 length:1128 start_codon:yes stop_codon:yes gene_type:complete
MRLHIILSLILFASYSFCLGQNEYGKSNDDARIVLNTFIPEKVLENTPSARKLFETKLGQIATINGLGGGETNTNNRFIISGDLNVLTKDVLPTAPPKYALTIETNLVIGDGVDGRSFATEYVEFKGVGVSQDKAFISAIKKINPRHEQIQSLIEKGKQKIIEYYNSQCDFILKKANSLSDSRNFDEAVYILTQVPKVCKECYDVSMDLAVEITKKKFEFECQSKIAEAKSLITMREFIKATSLLDFYTKDMECYSDVVILSEQINLEICSKFIGEARGHWANRDSRSAAQALANIKASSPCYEESLTIANNISEYLDEKEQREWNLNYEKYKDNLALKSKNLDNENARINLARDIGIAYGKNQSQNVTYKSLIE